MPTSNEFRDKFYTRLANENANGAEKWFDYEAYQLHKNFERQMSGNIEDDILNKHFQPSQLEQRIFDSPIQLYNPKKYYWFVFEFKSRFFDGIEKAEQVSEEHPFIEMKKWKLKALKDVALLNWKEITEEEFKLFNQPK